jgi:hypothetical protein
MPLALAWLDDEVIHVLALDDAADRDVQRDFLRLGKVVVGLAAVDDFDRAIAGGHQFLVGDDAELV